MTAPIKGNSCYRLNTICNFERISAPDPERSPLSSVQCYRVSCLVRWKTKHTWGYLKVHWILKRKSSWLTALKLIRLPQLCAKRNLSVSMVENINRSTHSSPSCVSLEDHHHLAVHLALSQLGHNSCTQSLLARGKLAPFSCSSAWWWSWSDRHLTDPAGEQPDP